MIALSLFGYSSFGPRADRRAIRCISYIVMGLWASLESVRLYEMKEANGTITTALPRLVARDRSDNFGFSRSSTP